MDVKNSPIDLFLDALWEKKIIWVYNSMRASRLFNFLETIPVCILLTEALENNDTI